MPVSVSVSVWQRVSARQIPLEPHTLVSELAKCRASNYSRQMPNLNLMPDPIILGEGGLEFVNIIWNASHTVHQLGSAQPALIRHCNYLEYVLILPQSETQYLVVSFPTYAELFRELE